MTIFDMQRRMQQGNGTTNWQTSGTPPGRILTRGTLGSGLQERLGQVSRFSVSNKGILTTALGIFSLGLGLAQIIAPDAMARLGGIRRSDRSRMVIRLIGARELLVGAGLFMQRLPMPFLWARVAGDAMDLTLLGRTLNACPADRDRTMGALAAVAGVTALDTFDSVNKARKGSMAGTHGRPGGIHVIKSITINRAPEKLYRFWRDFSNLPQFMGHLQSVQVKSDKVSHWKTTAPLGQTAEWDAEIVGDDPNKMIAWRSLKGADVDNEGAVYFLNAPGGRGTEVRVELHYNPPAGEIGRAFAALFGESAEQQIYDDLRSFKQIMETGEVLYSDSSYTGHPHPGQPPTEKRD